MRNDTRGEKRQPGRPLAHAYQDDPMSNFTIRMTAWHARMGRRIGDGNMSEGFRIALEDYVLRKDNNVNNCEIPQK